MMEQILIIHHFYATKFKPWHLAFWTTLMIRLKTNSLEFHTSIQVGDKYYEALFQKGVVCRKIKTTPSNSSVAFLVKKNKLFHQFHSHLIKQVGKKYDVWSTIFGFFSKKVDNTNRWYCSELNSIFFQFYAPEIQLKTSISPKGIKLLCNAYLCGINNKNKISVSWK